MTAHHRGTPTSRSPLPRPGGLIDNHGRRITYLRLGITDRCNLRCRYCMPDEGVEFINHAEILSFEELERLIRIVTSLGIAKIRITGGEPFVRHGCVDFLYRVRAVEGVRSLHVTTNGVDTWRYLDALAALAIDGINLSLDTLDHERFMQITRRDRLTEVLATLEGCLKRRLPLKINAVVTDDTTDDEFMALAELPRRHPLALRFIEKMPFSGTQARPAHASKPLKERLYLLFPGLVPVLSSTPATARLYTLSGFAGAIGLIEGNSRRFCPACNKIRITPAGLLKTCLYDNGVVDLKAMLRGGADDEEIALGVKAAVSNRYLNGLEAEALCARERDPVMASIGG